MLVSRGLVGPDPVAAAGSALKQSGLRAEKEQVPTNLVRRPARPRGETGSPLTVLPFALIAFLVIGALGLTDLKRPGALFLALALTCGLLAVQLLAPWRRLPRGAQDVPALAFYVVIVLLRDAGGGSGAGVGPLALLPVCWLAMYGGRTSMRLSLVATGAIFIAPWMLIGGSAYPPEDLRRGVTLMLVSILIGISVQSLVEKLHAQRATSLQAAEQTAGLAEQLAAVARVRHSMQVNQDPRQAICEGARDLTGAAVSFLLEPRDEQTLERTAGVGFELTPVILPMDPARSAGADCLLSGRRLFISDARTDSRIPQLLRAQVDASSLLYEPVVRRGKVMAVLVVGWRAVTDPSDAALEAMSLMAIEAAVSLEQADLLNTVQQLARTDQLTGAQNRRAFDELLPHVLKGATAAAPLCIALLDVDHFKAFNDTFGHPAGDRFLQNATVAWTLQLRGTDIIARFGGEEFAVVLPDCQLRDAVAVLDKLRRSTPTDQTISIGIAQWDGAESQQALLQRADTALYQAKADGRDRLHCAA
jgi:diguanylate cyclase (GGDEF)-like protein